MHCFCCSSVIYACAEENYNSNSILLLTNMRNTMNLKISAFIFVRCVECNMLLGEIIDEYLVRISMRKLVITVC